MIMPQYQNATLSVEKTGLWRICWYNTNPATGQLERIRKTCGLNRIADIKERQRIASGYMWTINNALAHGYNHFLTPAENAALPGICDLPQIKAAMAAAAPEITVVAALEKATKIRTLGLAKRSVDSYRSCTKSLTDWLTDEGLHLLPLSAFTADHYQDYLYYKSAKGHGNGNLNDHTIFIKSCFKELMRLKLVPANPLDGIVLLKEQESTLFQPLTEDELSRIVPVLLAYNPRYYLFTRFIPHEMMRPYHIARLKGRDISYAKKYIAVSGDTTKNKKSRKKQLMRPIMDMLIELKYHELPGNYYLFGANFEPSPTLVDRLSITAAEIWRELVIEGLGIDKKMYALKHTSSQYFVNENDKADVLFLQQHMEHHSMAQTEIYLQDKIVKRIDEKNTKMINY